MLPHLEQLLYAHGIRKKDHYQPSQGTCRATEFCFYQVGFLSLSTDRSPQQGGLSSSTHTCWISAWIIRTWDLSTDYSQCPQQLSKCSLSSWMNKEGINSRCCSFAGALTRGKDALHKQTPLHTTAALEHLECTSGWAHIWQHLLSPPYCQGGSLKSETAAVPRQSKTQSCQDRLQTLPCAQESLLKLKPLQANREIPEGTGRSYLLL